MNSAKEVLGTEPITDPQIVADYHMMRLHTEKTEAFYQEVLKINLDAAMHSSRAHGLEEPVEQLRLEAEWSADEVAYGLEIRLADAQLADIEADVKAGCSM